MRRSAARRFVLASAVAAGCGVPPQPPTPAAVSVGTPAAAATRPLPPGPPVVPPPTPPATPSPPPAAATVDYPEPLQLTAHLRRELVGIAGAKADGNLTADEATAARGRAVDHLIGSVRDAGDGQWLREQLNQVVGLRADGLLTDAEARRARDVLVKMYLR